MYLEVRLYKKAVAGEIDIVISYKKDNEEVIMCYVRIRVVALNESYGVSYGRDISGTVNGVGVQLIEDSEGYVQMAKRLSPDKKYDIDIYVVGNRYGNEVGESAVSNYATLLEYGLTIEADIEDRDDGSYNKEIFSIENSVDNNRISMHMDKDALATDAPYYYKIVIVDGEQETELERGVRVYVPMSGSQIKLVLNGTAVGSDNANSEFVTAVSNNTLVTVFTDGNYSAQAEDMYYGVESGWSLIRVKNVKSIIKTYIERRIE